MNKVLLIGIISRAPKTYLTQHGKEFMTFFVETTHSWKACPREGGEPEWHSATDRHRVSVFPESSVWWVKDVLKCGDHVSLEGKLTYQHWTDKFGQSRFTPHVVIAKEEGKVEHFACNSTKNGKRISNLNSNQNLANSNSELSSETTSTQKVLTSNSEENEDALFELSQEQINPSN
jgi:single stranded DNA-binding protein